MQRSLPRPIAFPADPVILPKQGFVDFFEGWAGTSITTPFLNNAGINCYDKGLTKFPPEIAGVCAGFNSGFGWSTYVDLHGNALDAANVLAILVNIFHGTHDDPSSVTAGLIDLHGANMGAIDGTGNVNAVMDFTIPDPATSFPGSGNQIITWDYQNGTFYPFPLTVHIAGTDTPVTVDILEIDGDETPAEVAALVAAYFQANGDTANTDWYDVQVLGDVVRITAYGIWPDAGQVGNEQGFSSFTQVGESSDGSLEGVLNPTIVAAGEPFDVNDVLVAFITNGWTVTVQWPAQIPAVPLT